MKATVKLLDGVRFEGTTGSGHSVIMDGPPEHGGQDSGPRPMEMLLLGTGACSGFDVVHILRRSRQDVTGCEVDVDADRADTEPKIFTAIRLHFTVRGRGLKENVVRRAVELSAEKYCSASIMLAKTATITHDFQIVEET